MRWIILKEDNKTVHNVIVADVDFIAQHYPNAIEVADDVVVALNDTYKNGVVTRTLPILPVEEPTL
jgi:hypothetical protein